MEEREKGQDMTRCDWLAAAPTARSKSVPMDCHSCGTETRPMSSISSGRTVFDGSFTPAILLEAVRRDMT